MASKRQHTSCTLKNKLEVIKRLDSGESVSKLASELNIGKSTICDWGKNRSKLEKFYTVSAEKSIVKKPSNPFMTKSTKHFLTDLRRKRDRNSLKWAYCTRKGFTLEQTFEW